jgi:probable phosphoglycerate mutase
MAKRPAPPSPTTVLLVRHGQTTTTGSVLPGRAKGLHLAPVGQEQAARAAERIASVGKVAAVYASPLERTRETAAPIAKRLGLKVSIARGLIEADFGEWTGRKLAELMKLPEWRKVQSSPSTFRFPNGESFPEMQARIVGAIDQLVVRHPGERIVVVSHADPLKEVVAHASGIHLDLFQRIVISPCSITPLLLGGDRPVVLAVNSTGEDLSTLAPS